MPCRNDNDAVQGFRVIVCWRMGLVYLAAATLIVAAGHPYILQPDTEYKF